MSKLRRKANFSLYLFMVVFCAVTVLSAIFMLTDNKINEVPAEITSGPPCNLDQKDLVNHTPHEKSLPTAYNLAINTLKNSAKSQKLFTKKNIGHTPQAILGYFEETSFFKSKKAELFFAKGIVGKGAFVKELLIVDALDGAAIKSMVFDSGQMPLHYQQCFSFRLGGCDFKTSYAIDLEGIDIGAYYVFLKDNENAWSAPIFLNIKPKLEDLAKYDVLLLLPDTTWHAYNNFGGGSLYGIQKVEESQVTRAQNETTRLYSVGLNRPLATAWEYRSKGSQQPYVNFDWNPAAKGDLPMLPSDLIRSCIGDRTNIEDIAPCYYWTRPTAHSSVIFGTVIRNTPYSFAFIGMRDLQYMNKGELSVEPLLLITGHNEYFTRRMEDLVEDFSLRGGQVLNMSGNVDWWRINIIESTMYQDQFGEKRSKECQNVLPEHYQYSGQRGYAIKPGTENLFGVSYRYGGLGLPFLHNYPATSAYRESTLDILPDYSDVKVIDINHPLFSNIPRSENGYLKLDPYFLDDEIDGLPMRDGKIDTNLPLDLPYWIKPLALGTSFLSYYHYGYDGTYYSGAVESAVIVESRLSSSETTGTILSIGTIGASYAIQRGDNGTKRMLINGIKYLKAL